MAEEILINVEVDTSKETAELDKLETSIESLTKEKGKLNDSTEENTKQIKENEKSTEAATDAFQNLNPALGGAIGAMKKMTLAAKAFIATPLGLIIAAIALALGSLFSFFQRSEEGQDALNKVTRIFGSIVDNLLDVVDKFGKLIFEAVSNPKQTIIDLGNLIKENIINRFKAFAVVGKAIVKILSGDLKEGFKDLGNGAIQLSTGITDFSDKAVAASQAATDGAIALGKEIASDIERAKVLADLEAKQNRLERIFTVEQAERQAQIEELRLKAREENEFDAAQRREFLVEASALLDIQLSKEQEIAQLRFDIIKENNMLANSTIETKEEEAEAEAELSRLRAKRFTEARALQREFLRVENQLKKELSDEVKLQREESALQLESEQELQLFRLEQQAELGETVSERIQAELDFEILKTQFLLENDELLADQRLLIEERLAATLDAIKTKALDKQVADAQKAAKKEEKTDEDLAKAKIGSERSVSNAVREALGEKSELSQAANVILQKGLIAETIANTEAAAIAAFKSFASIPIIGTILGAAAAAAIALQGARAVARIGGLTFEHGGVHKIGGRRHSSGGTKFVGSDGSSFEAERGENLYILNRSASSSINSLSAFNQRHGGRSFSSRGGGSYQDGGFVNEPQISEIERRVRGNQELLRIIRNLPAQEVNVVKVTRAQNEVAITEGRANV